MPAHPFLLERLQEAIHRFEEDLPKADRMLAGLCAQHRLGARDRAWLRDRFYYYIRHRSTFLSGDGGLQPAQDLAAKLEQYCTENTSPDPQGDSAADFPAWLQEAAARLWEDPSQVLRWLDQRAPSTLRIHPLRLDRETARRKLLRDGITTRDTVFSPWGLIALENEQHLSATNLFRYGSLELQDESSQLACLLTDPEHTTVLDACAGGGGKTLALAGLQPHARITASDIREYKLKTISQRVQTADLKVELCTISELTGRQFDTVLVDAPCSGSGALRRNPEDRWRITPDALQNLLSSQAAVLDQYADLVRPGGELVYVTCSFIRDEDENQVQRFLERHADFYLVPAGPRLRERLPSPDLSPLLQGDFFRTAPGQDRDLFFGAILQRLN